MLTVLGRNTMRSRQRGVPIDRGWAWVIVLASFLNHVVIIGTSRSFGMIFVELLEFYHGSASAAAVMFSLSGCLSLFIAPIVTGLAEVVTCRVMAVIGSLFIFAALLISSMATSLEQIILSYGLLLGLGTGCLLTPGPVIIAQYFCKKRSIANGISFAGSGVGAIIVPYMIYFLVTSYGPHGSMLILSGFCLNGLVFGALFRPVTFYLNDEQREKAAGVFGSQSLLGHSPLNCSGVHASRLNSVDSATVVVSTHANQSDDATEPPRAMAECERWRFLNRRTISADPSAAPNRHLQQSGGSFSSLNRLRKTAASLGGIPVAIVDDEHAAKEKLAGQSDVKPEYLSSWNLATTTISLYSLPSAPEFSYNLISADAASRARSASVTSNAHLPVEQSSSAQNLDTIEEEVNYKSITSDASAQAILRDVKASLSEPKHDVANAAKELLTATQTVPKLARDVSVPRESETYASNCFIGAAVTPTVRILPMWKRFFYFRNPVNGLWSPFIDLSLFKHGHFMLFSAATSLAVNYFWLAVVTPPRAAELHLTKQECAILLSAIGVSDTCGRLSAGVWGDIVWLKPKRLPLLFLVTFISGVSTCLSVLATTFVSQMAFTLITPFFYGAIATSIPVVLADIVGVQNMGKAWGLLLFQEGFSVLLGPILVGVLADWTLSWTSGYLYMGVSMVVASFLYMVIFIRQKRTAAV